MGSTPDAWHDFFVAATGAGAALAGLIFVAISINLREILPTAALVRRAGEAIVLLLMVVVVGLVGLTPGLETGMLGGFLVGIGVFAWSWVTYVQARALRGHANGTAGQRVAMLAVVEAATIPVVIAGLSLVVGSGGGLYWLVSAIICAVVAGVVDGWVLLVEILR